MQQGIYDNIINYVIKLHLCITPQFYNDTDCTNYSIHKKLQS